ncbi:alpha/beta fold hydrolase [Mesorhizobium sp. WSM4884]|uniref:alpha/beta fold hydrolase n=1 Tax=Mesorhizobium sp. WSM4884 TaxID=3038542 RepID=UPI002417094B|nr:alpha/beta fold hydrolase [Mesorhizobium sp. WSM4884]MDG4881597.1 alpha/beta fold hydrolase [Mesorhizobium sp. WSM4884]
MLPSLHVAESGAGLKTIIFLHGFGGCHSIWRDVIAALAPAVRALAYDLPGHGGSLQCESAGAKQAARAILTDLGARRLGKVHVVGHSMGGAIAALMALADPERVASLTLLAPGGFGPEINGPLARRYAAAANRDDIRACLAAMSGPRSAPPEHVVEALSLMRERPGQLQTLVDTAAVMTRGDRQGVIPGEWLATLSMPVMVIWGTDDPVLPVDQAETLPAHFHLHHVLEAGHMLAEEAPDVIAEVVRRNMRRRGKGQRSVFGAAAS